MTLQEGTAVRAFIEVVWQFLLTVILMSALFAAQSRTHVRTDMLVSTDWLAAHLQDPNSIVLCIVDDETFYSSGHIPGARMIRLSEIVTEHEGIPNELPTVSHLQRVFEKAGVSNSSRVILYGERSGVLAARAYFTLDYLGLADQTALLDGGLEKWRAENRQESTVTPPVRVSKLAVKAHPEIVVDLKQMSDYSLSNKAVALLMDARPKAEYGGEKLSEDVSKAGHIPHAVGLYWRDLLRDGSIPQLKPPAELQEQFRASGAKPEKEVISYCRSGMQSSFSYFVAKYLGYEAKMYDGSFYEWSRSSHPVEP